MNRFLILGSSMIESKEAAAVAIRGLEELRQVASYFCGFALWVT
jgi:hypothetical protein